jgi:hypothetical protein
MIISRQGATHEHLLKSQVKLQMDPIGGSHRGEYFNGVWNRKKEQTGMINDTNITGIPH